jgi:putative Mn2+ efflux pump MntP
MHLLDMVFISFGDSMDAFAVSAANSCGRSGSRLKTYILPPIVFGLFQGAMVTIGYFLGSFFTGVIGRFAGLAAMIILCVLGGKMILDAIRHKEDDETPAVTLPLLMVQGLATSIDALAIGVSVSFLAVDIVFFAFFNCVITLAICAVGCLIGRGLGKLLGKKAAIIGGLVLIIIGVKIFIEGLQ